MKYKVGDKVRINSLDWYNKNKGNDGIVEFSTSVFVPGMSQFCGKVVTIEAVFDEDEDDVIYCMEEIGYDWTDEMIEGLVEDEVGLVDNLSSRWVNEFNLPDGYVFKDENGNEILTSKIILEKKKKEVTYPKTYEECCEIVHSDPKFYVDTHLYSGILETLYKLLICCDAYWKIAGDEMGLGKPWEPDWSDTSIKYCLEIDFGVINKNVSNHKGHTFAFPTPEMRDAFENNFVPDLEICKEFL